MADLKHCPFCGCEIEITKNVVNEYKAVIECSCRRCQMEFSHVQYYTMSKGDRMAVTEDFTTVWNRRTPEIVKVETCFYDKEEIHENCTVQVLTNTKTGEVSVGWWENED